MRRKLTIALVLSVSLLVFVGCGKKDTPVQTPVTEEETTAEETTVEEAAPATEEEAAPAAEESKEGMVRNPVTNEWIDQSLENQRPIAVMYNNVTAALPQANISKADLIYECNVEGSLTRLMCIFKDWKGLEKIGPVRSCRDYYVYWALEWDGIYCHFGGPKLYVDFILGQDYVNHLDGTYLDGSAYFRTSDRKAPHNAYTSGEGIAKALKQYDYSETYTSNYEGEHFTFASESNPVTLDNGVSATHVEPGYTINKPVFTYNESDGLYYREQYGAPHVDQLTGDQVAVKNIILQYTYHEVRDAKGYLAFKDHDKGRGGYYITNGKAIPITWEKSSDFSPTTYYDESGNEITLNTGKTFICIIEDGTQDSIVLK